MTPEYKEKFEAVIGQFPKGFRNKYDTDSMAKNAVESLLRGASPFDVIDALIIERHNMLETLIRMMESEKPEKGQLIFDKSDVHQQELYDKLKKR